MPIYNHEQILKSLKSRIKDSNYPDEWKYLIFQFSNVLFSEGIKEARVLKYMSQLNLLARDHNLNLANSNKSDIYRVVGEIEKKELADWTKYGYKTTIMHFFDG